MKYACLVYHDASKVADLPEAEQLAAIVAECEAAGAWHAEVEKGGHHVFSAGLQSVRTAITVRNCNGKLSMTDGPFAETKEFLGGFTIIEARNLDEVLQLVSKFASCSRPSKYAQSLMRTPNLPTRSTRKLPRPYERSRARRIRPCPGPSDVIRRRSNRSAWLVLACLRGSLAAAQAGEAGSRKRRLTSDPGLHSRLGPSCPSGRAGREDLVNRHGPAGNRWFGIGCVASAAGDGTVRRIRMVNVHAFRERVDIRDDERAGFEVIGALGRHFCLARLAVVGIASDFHGKGRWSGDE